MSIKILAVIDLQNDFITGSLGSEQAKAIIPNVAKKIRKAVSDPQTLIFYTMDTHNSNYLNGTLEGKKLPVEHCIKPTWGWQIHEEIAPLLTGTKGIEKTTFAGAGLFGAIDDEMRNNIAEIELVGLCTDICVISNAFLLRALYPNMPIKVDASCCAGTSIEAHNAALMVMKSCQIDIINEDGVGLVNEASDEFVSQTENERGE